MSLNHHNRRVFSILLASLAIVFFAVGCSDILPDSTVKIGGKEYPADSEYIKAPDGGFEDYSALSAFENLKTLDLTDIDISVTEYDTIRKEVKGSVEILWLVPFGTDRLPSNTREIYITPATNLQDPSVLRYFYSLESVNIDSIEVSEQLEAIFTAIQSVGRDIEITCSTSVYGVGFDTNTALLDLNDVKISETDALERALRLFPNITSVEMCRCGLSNEVMAGLRDRYPDKKFVWIVKFLKYSVRSDIQVFSTLAVDFDRPGNSETLAPLFRYCTELRALDLGHQALTDISEIVNLKHLHTLILADNAISDISPLAELKELNFVELFCNRITDISPLTELPNLEDLNICFNRRIKNPLELAKCKKLRRLYAHNCSISGDNIKTIRSSLSPDCEFSFYGTNAVHQGWRTKKDKKNVQVRTAFKNWKKVKEFPRWDTIVYY